MTGVRMRGRFLQPWSKRPKARAMTRSVLPTAVLTLPCNKSFSDGTPEKAAASLNAVASRATHNN